MSHFFTSGTLFIAHIQLDMRCLQLLHHTLHSVRRMRFDRQSRFSSCYL
jgi:hypothetical protein